MKKDNFAFLDIFQDPLMTIIALILLSTVWMLLPTETESYVNKSGVAMEEIASLKDMVRLMEEKIKELEEDILAMKDTLTGLQKEADEYAKKGGVNADRTEYLKKEIDALRKVINGKKEELAQLQRKLENLEKTISHLNVKEGIKRVLAEIEKLKRKIDEGTKELGLLEERIKKAREKMEAAEIQKSAQEGIIAGLQNELETFNDEINRLESEIKSEEKGRIRTGGSFTKVFSSKKKATYIELANNMLFTIDEKHYDVEVGYVRNGGRRVKAAQLTRKASSGERMDEIEESNSDLSNMIKTINADTQRIIFLLHNDSFEIFRKARTFALDSGIEIGWWPREGNTMVFYLEDGHGINIGSTNAGNRS